MLNFLGTDLPIIQAPMAGVQDSRLAAAVSNAGGLGSLPCAMLTAAALRAELEALKGSTNRPFNLNFFAHTPPEPDTSAEKSWRAALAPYYREYGLDEGVIANGPGRQPFNYRRLFGKGRLNGNHNTECDDWSLHHRPPQLQNGRIAV